MPSAASRVEIAGSEPGYKLVPEYWLNAIAMPTETSPTLKMNTSHDPATRMSPDAERENTPPGGASVARGALRVVDMTSPPIPMVPIVSEAEESSNVKQ